MLIIPFTSEEATLSNAGGKGVNLARMARAGFPVPPGYIVSTTAYRDFLETNSLQPILSEVVADLSAAGAEALEGASQHIRTAFSKGRIPRDIELAIRQAYRALNSIPVAVRSSATTEDLPELSFAGQQDTFLNITDEEQLMIAVVDSWSSLWTARAIGYRIRNHIDHRDAALAVIVQRLVESDVSGVLFTANPLTGKLNETVVDATPGLGEALVSGQVEPDHFILDGVTGVVIERRIGEKKVASRLKDGGGVESVAVGPSSQPCLTERDLKMLVRLGADVQAEFGSPQDVEWAIAAGKLHLLQSRPITSLYPVPEVSIDPLIIWLSFGSVQGLVGPITPLGRDIILHIIAGGGRLFKLDLEPDTMKVIGLAGERLWARVSGMMRHPAGVKLMGPIFRFIEPSVGQILERLASEPQLGAGTGKFRLTTIARLLYFVLPIAPRFLRNILFPARARMRLEAKIESRLSRIRIAHADDPLEQLAQITLMIRTQFPSAFPFLIPHFVPLIGPGMAALNLLTRVAGDQTSLALEVSRALPGNVTSEMDIALWKTAVEIGGDADSATQFRTNDPDRLAADFLSGDLADVAQESIQRFMEKYGMRGVGEIDFGQTRWREDPTPIMHILVGFLAIDHEHAPEAMFARGIAEAHAATEVLAAKARELPYGRLRARLVRGAARRVRALSGSRESPKFYIIRVMGIARNALLEVGSALVEAGIIVHPDDLVYLNLAELDALSRGDLNECKTTIAQRRAVYAYEQRRRQVPRVLASDGRAFYEGLGAASDTDHKISGSPVSPGVVEGIVHVVLDPRGAQLQAGEILVCPGTDPAWTPLLMAASGLITEVGGLMTHGSVVAREFGIPAVVGVHKATERLKDGQRVRVDGATGVIAILPAP